MGGGFDREALRPGLYCLPGDPLGREVLIPAFRGATSVRGAFGWFSAGWIGRLAPGLAWFLNRDDTAGIDFTIAPALFPDEKAKLGETIGLSPKKAAELVADVFIAGRITASAIERHALDCLAWMVARRTLRLRVAVPKPSSSFHPKMWLFDDGNAEVLARGSGNATARGVADGVETFDVDVSWQTERADRIAKGARMLDQWTRGESPGVARVLPMPEALLDGIVSTAPSAPPQPEDYERITDRAWTNGRSPRPRLRIPEGLKWRTGAYAHQGEAVAAWEGTPDPERGTLSMATGAGKTITALICATQAQDRVVGRSFLLVVSAPSKPLVAQWKMEVARFGVDALAPSLGGGADKALGHLLRELPNGGTQVLLLTNSLLCKPAVQATIRYVLSRCRGGASTMLVADEAHTLGSQGFLRNPPVFLERRLALSATPVRQYDPEGTKAVFEFFGPPAYEFGLDRAIGFCLVPYQYLPHVCFLDDQELERFTALSRKIGAATAANNDDAVQRLAIQRRRVVESAAAKPALLRAVLQHRRPDTIHHALVYASAKNPAQFGSITAVLDELDIRWARVTQAETREPRQLSRTLAAFRDGTIQVLVAKKVLDEGVDIPSIREAFLVASSQVKREWIQRRGRILRQCDGKTRAVLHDVLAMPSPGAMTYGRSAQRLATTELERAFAFFADADDPSIETHLLADLRRLRSAYFPTSSGAGLYPKDQAYVVARGTPTGSLS